VTITYDFEQGYALLREAVEDGSHVVAQKEQHKEVDQASQLDIAGFAVEERG